MTPCPPLLIRKTDEKGRGVFATTRIKPGTLIESCEVIVAPREERPRWDTTVLKNYYFKWGIDGEDAAIALGNGSLYNHSHTPNAKYLINLETNTLDFIAIQKIHPEEEITVNYNGDPTSDKLVWFEKVEQNVDKR